MPGRIASATAPPRAARKSTATRSTRTIRNSSPVTEIPDEGEDNTLRHSVCQAFADAQKSTAGQRKAIISLRRIQESCCYEPATQTKGRQSEDFDEEDFNREIVRCVLRILPVKKSEPVGDRIVRFLGTFLNVASGKDNEIIAQDDEVDEPTLPETPTSRLATLILSTLIPLLQAKEKAIRFRATQLTSHIVNSLDTLDDSLFHKLRLALLKRIHDKEVPVRLQAVYGLGRLAAEVEEDEDEDSDSEDDVRGSVLKKLLSALQNDPSAEVRRNLLLNLPLTKEVLPYLLERARDADAATRRALYARLLPALGDFRHLSMTHREKLLRWGLRDRDESVRKATAKLFCERWIEDCAALPASQAAEEGEHRVDQEKKEAVPSLDALLELLERIDVVNRGREEDSIALIALREFWLGRSDYLEYVSFPDSFWDELSPELAFVARTFNDFCRSPQDPSYSGPSLENLAEDKLPEVTRFGYLLEREIKKLIQAAISAAEIEDENKDEEDEELAHAEFIVEQMLHMALTFDYSDEVGRRKMYTLMREALALAELPEEVTRLVVEVLRLVCGDDAQSEREFCAVVLEAIAEVHDTIMGEGDAAEADSTEESFHSATSQVSDDDTIVVSRKKAGNDGKDTDPEAEAERAIRSIMVNMKCLHIALCMLQNVQCELEENPHLVTMLNSLVVPAVRSQEAPIRERGMLCLGLCCLLGQNLAQENLSLFLHCFAKGHPELQAIALQIITDILITHPTLLTVPTSTNDSQSESDEFTKPVIKAFTKSLKSDHASVQSTGAVALSKAMLSRLITDSELLKTLVITYFDPDSAANAQLRQSLSYFLPVYCHSRAENALRMAEISCSIISKLSTVRDALLDDLDEELEGPGGDGMVKLAQVGTMLLDWTDPRRVVGFSEAANDASVALGAGETHFIIAESILERLVTSQVTKDEKKVLLGMLGKLHFPAGGADKKLIESILELAAEAVETKVAPTATDKNALTKIQNNLLKIMHDLMTEERGGGGAEETIVETTELQEQSELEDDTIVHVKREAEGSVNDDDEEDGDEASDVTQLQQEMRDATIGATTMGFTTGAPDAEGTRIGLDDGDTEMMDIDS